MKCQRVGCSARADVVVADGGRALAVCDFCAVAMQPDSIFVDIDPTTDGLAEARDLLAAGPSEPAPTEAPASTDPAVSPPTEVSPAPSADLEPTPVVGDRPMPCRVPGCTAAKLKGAGLCDLHYNRGYWKYVKTLGRTVDVLGVLSTAELADLAVVRTPRPIGQSKARAADAASGLLPQPAMVPVTYQPPLRILLTAEDLQRRADLLYTSTRLPTRDTLLTVFPMAVLDRAELFVQDLRRQLETEALEVDVDAAKAA